MILLKPGRQRNKKKSKEVGSSSASDAASIASESSQQPNDSLLTKVAQVGLFHEFRFTYLVFAITRSPSSYVARFTLNAHEFWVFDIHI